MASCAAGRRAHHQLSAEELEAALARLSERAPSAEELGADLLCFLLQGRDGVLKRFLLASAGDVNAALQMLENTLAWRKHNNVAKALDANLPEEAVATLVEHHRMLFAGFDKTGAPVFLDKSAATNWSAVLRVLTAEQAVWAHVQWNEFTQRVVLPYASRRAGHAVTRFVSVIDLKGLSITSLNRRVLDLLSQVATVDQKHYPETLAAVYLINPPSAFSTILKLLQPLISPATRRKIVDLGSGPDMVAALRSALGPDVHLPAAMLTGSKPAKPCVDVPAGGAGLADFGACCFEYIADVERSIAAGGDGTDGTHRHAVMTSLFGDAAQEGRQHLPRRATFTMVTSPPAEASKQPAGAPLDRKMSVATVYHDAVGHNHDEHDAADPAAERERFYTQRMLAWVQTAAAQQEDDIAVMTPAPAEASGSKNASSGTPRRCCCFR